MIPIPGAHGDHSRTHRKGHATPTQLLDDYAATSDRYDEIARRRSAAIRAVISLHRQGRNARADHRRPMSLLLTWVNPPRHALFVVDGETHQCSHHTTRASGAKTAFSPGVRHLQAISDALQGGRLTAVAGQPELVCASTATGYHPCYRPDRRHSSMWTNTGSPGKWTFDTSA